MNLEIVVPPHAVKASERAAKIGEWINTFGQYCFEKSDEWRLYHDTVTLDVQWADKYSLAALETWRNKQGAPDVWTLKGDYLGEDALPPLDGDEGVSVAMREFLRVHLGLVIAERAKTEMMELRAFGLGYRTMSESALRRRMNAWLKENPTLLEWMNTDGITVHDLVSAALAQGKKHEAA
jgi:hypothetical protein